MISISIICSFYKMDKFYKYFLESVVNQIGFKNNIELVICLNKPSKQVVNLTNKFKTKYKKNIQIIIPKNLTTLGESWNLCLKKSKGKNIAIWNADDQRVQNSLLMQENILNKNKKISFVYGNYFIVKSYNSKNKTIFVNEKYREKKELKESMILGPFFMFKKSVCNKIGFFDEQLKSSLDFDFAIRLAYHFSGKHLNKNLGYYLNEGKGLSTTKNSLQEIETNVIYLRYGLFHKILKKKIKKAINYKIYHYIFFNKKFKISKYFENYKNVYTKNKKKNLPIYKKKKFGLLGFKFNFK